MKDKSTQTLSLTLDVFPENDEQYAAVRNSIDRYRACVRKVYSVLAFSKIAGADIEESAEKGLRVVPRKEPSKAILENAMGEKGKALAYECRGWVLGELYPDALSFVWDSVRRDVTTTWSSKDPQFQNATRAWLTQQGARNLARFNRQGIGFPQKTGRPKLDNHGVTLKWDHVLGPVLFKLRKMDGGRWATWKRILEGVYKPGTVYLGERDGQLRLTVSYAMPIFPSHVLDDRTLELRFSEKSRKAYFRAVGPDGIATYDSIAISEALSVLDRLKCKRDKIEERKASCGNPSRPWGHRHGWRSCQDLLTPITRQRTKFVADRNHAWARRIVTRAHSWRCGQILVFPAPKDLMGRPWQWYQFIEFLKYKAARYGIRVVKGLPKAQSTSTTG